MNKIKEPNAICVECRGPFYRKKHNIYYCSPQCERCFYGEPEKIYDRSAYYLKNKEKTALKSKEYYRENHLKMILISARIRATKNNIPFNIELSDLKIPDFCPLLGIEIKQSISGRTNNSPSIDRKIPELGYVKGNVWIISWKANRIKSDLNRWQLRMFCEELLKNI